MGQAKTSFRDASFRNASFRQSITFFNRKTVGRSAGNTRLPGS
jgi:hypothetical protein